MCGCASVPAETAALSSRTLRPRPVKPIVKAAACSSARSIPRVMRIRIVRLIGLQNALCSGIRAGAQGIRRSCCRIQFMGSCLRIRIQDCFGGMIFYRIKKVFRNSLQRRFCKLRIEMENGELRSCKALCGRPTAAPAVTQGADGLQAVRRGRTLRYHPLSNKTRRCRP